MEIRQLRYFIAVARELSFSAAARKIHIAQPALTRQIRSLEESVGVGLLERQARGVTLTPAGKVFLQDAERILSCLEEAKHNAIKTEKGMQGELRMGVTVMLLWVKELSGLLKEFRRRYPKVMLKLNTMLSGPQINALREGNMDLGILIFPPEGEEFGRLKIYQDHLVLVAPVCSEIASNPPQCLADIRDYDFVWFDRENSPNYYDRLIGYFNQCGFTPNIVETGNDSVTMLSVVASGVGCTIVPSSTINECPAGLTVIEVVDLKSLPLDLQLVWRQDCVNPMLDNMIKVAHELVCGDDYH
ncbi:LysR family transcriptional regulator [Vibrio sp. CAIM 722]|uniref:LysR family transcriptional regulator n=1 Tax=Vibrio eleionomae TaxID=2653505 RepID=A0A7X4RTJ5_9VIBR|nr:LysR family transcriptional regulator [Vibrio eleionomae]MZI92856.1 LysR family transcriptional regulator [Vibrio eleionomae]